MRVHITSCARLPEHRAKAARVTIAQGEISKNPVDVIMPPGGWRLAAVQHAQRSCHAEVNDEPAFVDFEQQVFATSLDLTNQPSAQQAGKTCGNRPAQSARAHLHLLNPASRDIRLNSPAGHFNFWQLWHIWALCNLCESCMRVL